MWDSFKYRARSFPNVPAVEVDDCSLTYASLFEAAWRIALSLKKSGVGEGSSVALCLPNTAAFVPAFLALCRVHAKIVLLSPRYGSSDLSAIFRGVRVTALLTQSSRGEEFRKTIPGLAPPVDLREAFPQAPLALLSLSDGTVNPDLLPAEKELLGKAALIKTTSGSTGVPKSVALEAAALLTEAENVARSLALEPGDQILAPVPLSHSYGFDLGVLAALYSGATLRAFEAVVPRRILAALIRKETKVFLGVPSMYQILLDNHQGSDASLSHIRYALSCTAPLPRKTINAFYERF